jgi:hypothetical protein
VFSDEEGRLMSLSQSMPIPQVFVLWHPRCQIGETLARRIFAWLRPGNGLGPEVFFRSLPAPGNSDNRLPPLLPGESRFASGASSVTQGKASNFQVVLALIDENMVADMTWRLWLEDLTKKCETPRAIMPVALGPTAFNMPPAFRALNYLRPSGLPILAGAGPGGPAFEGAVRSLLKQVTEAMCRVLLPRSTAAAEEGRTSTAGDALPKVNVFLSHAKQDGTVPARRLRDYIYSQTQLAAFYDENDIAFGSSFGPVIEKALASRDTAAFIAVRSARYASRPWCRREFSLFRRPQRENPDSSGAECWRIYPSLVVEAMEGQEQSAGIPELGNSPVIRWSDDDHSPEELIVTTVIRDAMLAAFHSALGASLPSKENQIVINWLPDPTTLLQIPSARSPSTREVLYPGRGLSGLELETLDRYFPNLEFRCFEEVLTEEVLG